MTTDYAAARLALDLVPTSVLRRVLDHDRFLDGLAKHAAMDDDQLYRTTEVCLKNVRRLDLREEYVGLADADLQIVVLPELWERLRPGCRRDLRRITSTLAEYDADQPSIFKRLLSPESLAQLRVGTERLRTQIVVVKQLDDRALVGRLQVALAGSRAGDDHPPEAYVYEPALTYRVAPVVAQRVLARRRSGRRMTANRPSDTDRFATEAEASRAWLCEEALGFEALIDEIAHGKRRLDLLDYLDRHGFPRKEIHRWEDDGGPGPSELT